MKCLKFSVVLIYQLFLYKVSSHNDNISVENRKLFFNISKLEYLEEKYENIIKSLPKQIDEARDAIVKDIATRNMLGYVLFVGFFLGFLMDAVGELLMNYKSFSEAFQDTEYVFLFAALLFDSLGNGAEYLSTVFNAGDPNLPCSSEDFFDVVQVHNQVLDPQQLSKLSQIQYSILTERFQRDFSTRLSCILQRISEYREAMIVYNSFQNLLKLHEKLANTSIGVKPNIDPEALDNELEEVWYNIMDLTNQVL